MTINFALSHQIIKRMDGMILASGSRNYVTAQFDLLTEDWTAPITAIFNEYTVVLDEDNQCLVPWEVLANPGQFQVSAFCGDLHTATTVSVRVHPSGYTDGQTPQPPTPDVYAQLAGMVQTAVDTANDVKERADSGEFNGKDGAPGADGKDAPQIDDTQASPDHPWSGAKVEKEVNQLSEQIGNVNKEVADAREGYFGEQYDSLCERIDGDINNVLDKVNVMAYEGTYIHATNTYARNLNVNRNKVEILGQTIQNCLDHSSADKFNHIDGVVDEEGFIQAEATGSYLNFNLKTGSFIAKPGTTYTFVVYVLQNTMNNNEAIRFNNNDISFFVNHFESFTNIPSGITKFLAKTKDDLETGITYSLMIHTTGKATTGTLKFRVAIIEGDWTGKDVSWVPFGLNTPQTTEVKMVGKNLIEPNPFGDDKFDLQADGSYKGIGDLSQSILPITEIDLPQGDYTLSYKVKCPVGKNYRIKLKYSDGSTKENYVVSTGEYIEDSLTIVRDKKLVGIRWNFSSGSSLDVYYKDLQIEKGSQITEYEQHTENIVNINNPLGSVSDTVRDRVYLKDGKAYYEQNTAEIVLDGSEDENWRSDSSGNNYFYIRPKGLKDNSKALCDKSVQVNYSSLLKGPSQFYISSAFVLGADRSEFPDVPDIKAWLQSNPITVRYQLDAPVTTEISIADFYSYAGQTNWYTTNAIKQILKAEIPSDISAVVSSAVAENTALKQENAALSQQVTALSEELQVSKILLGVD